MVGRLLTFWVSAYFHGRTVSFREGITFEFMGDVIFQDDKFQESCAASLFPLHHNEFVVFPSTFGRMPRVRMLVVAKVSPLHEMQQNCHDFSRLHGLGKTHLFTSHNSKAT